MNISRRSLLAGSLAAAQAGPALAQQSAKPNIIVILFDDLGVSDLGYLGASDLLTPNIDRLARGGTVFNNWYSNAPVCAPARSALMTGRVPIRAGVPANGPALRPTEITIASQLKTVGYDTALIGKWHLGGTPDTVPNAHGFDYYYGFLDGCVDYYSHRFYWADPTRVNFHDLWRNREEVFEDGRYLTERFGEEASAFVAKPRQNPFFLYLALNAVHYPMHAPQKYVDRFPNLPKERQMYAAMLSAADDAIGSMLKSLEQSGQAANTLIYLLGDNGATTERRAGLNQQAAMAGKNGVFRGFKFSAFDGGMHVPGLVYWPGHVPAGARKDQVVMTADIFPTLCRLAGTQVPQDRTLDGRDMWPVITENAPSRHDYVAWAQGPQLAIRQGDWKLVLNGVVYDGTPAGSKPLTGDDAVFLSNLRTDPGEKTNLRHQHPEVVDSMQTLVQEWRKSVEKN